MKVLFMTGSHPRHAHIARVLQSTGKLAGLIIENREEHIPVAPNQISNNLKALFDLHFYKRFEAESKFFTNQTLPEVEILNIEREELNSEKVHHFIKKINPDLLLSYGVHMLSNETIYSCNGERWNIHGGLSPWYKGCITHFWPSYFLEPQMTGMTVHNLTQQLDAGDVVHQSVAELVYGDGLHDLSCRAVLSIANDLPALVNKLADGLPITKYAHKTSGKLWTSNDWRPEHLKLIYELYNDKIVDAYLDNQLQKRAPKLYTQF